MIEASMVEITKKEYESLIKDRDMLRALEAGGVDSWEWYEDSLASFWEEELDES